MLSVAEITIDITYERFVGFVTLSRANSIIVHPIQLVDTNSDDRMGERRDVWIVHCG